MIDKLALSKHFEDKRTRQVADQLFYNIVDHCIILASKTIESGSISKSKAEDSNKQANEKKGVRARKDSFGLGVSLIPSDLVISQDLVSYLAERVIPNVC